MKKQLVIFAALIVTNSLSLGATLSSINQDQFIKSFVGKTFSAKTSISTTQLNGKEIDNSVTVYMDNKGTIQGKYTHKPAHAPQTDQGVYSIKDDGMICMTWQHWFNGKEECVYAYDTQNAYVMVDNNHIFHFSIMKFAIKPGDNLKYK
jgi:hypothetical protein